MERTWLGGRIALVQGDLTRLAVDAIVNAANGSLLGGGGVDGAIHRAAGPELLAECRTLGGARTGEVKVTGGYRLPRAASPPRRRPRLAGRRRRRGRPPRVLLPRGDAARARARDSATIAFPSISTGVYGFPIERAAPIAVREVRRALEGGTSVARALFCCFSASDREVYERTLDAGAGR